MKERKKEERKEGKKKKQEVKKKEKKKASVTRHRGHSMRGIIPARKHGDESLALFDDFPMPMQIPLTETHHPTGISKHPKQTVPGCAGHIDASGNSAHLGPARGQTLGGRCPALASSWLGQDCLCLGRCGPLNITATPKRKEAHH